MVAAALATAWVVVLRAPSVSAMTLTASPDPTPDGAPGSLRAVLAAATSAGGDEIDLQAGGTYTLTCAGGGQLAHGLTPLTITTPSGPPATILQTCPGQRVLVQSLGLLTLHNLVVTGGNYAPALPFLPLGGAIEELFGSVEVSDSTFENNSVTAAADEPVPAAGGAIDQFGSNMASPSVTVINSTFAHNAVLASADPSCSMVLPGNCGDAFGGAIHADNPVTVENSTFTDNTATDPHPGSANFGVGAAGGAIDSSNRLQTGGPVTVTNSTFTNNTATALNASAYGGAISADANPTPSTVTNSVFTHNVATGQIVASGGALAIPLTAGFIATTGPLAATGSTFADNTASAPTGTGWGGAIGVPIGGFLPTTVTNSTITANVASTAGGGIFVDRLNSVYSTMVDNTAPTGANVSLFGTPLGATGLASFGSVLALPHGGGSNCSLNVTPTASSFSYSDDSSCKLAGTGDRQQAGDPMLAALADNGGPAPTRLPLLGSPLLDTVPAASCQADGAAGITTDERGLPRPDPGAPTCDIGAVEVQAPPPPPTVGAQPGSGTAGHALPVQPVIDAPSGDLVGLSITPGTGTPGAVLSCASNPVAAVGGVASFAGCSIDRPGRGYTLTATDLTTGVTVISAPFDVGGASRIFGVDAIQTAIVVSQGAFPVRGSAGAVVLARSDFFSDALAGGPLAAKVGGPLLLTPGPAASGPSVVLDARVLSEIQRVLPVGSTVYLLGGPQALSPSIDEVLATAGYVPMRVAGPNEYATAVAIAHQLGDPTTVFEATGLNFPDALSAVPAAIHTHGAILLTNGTTQAAETATYLRAHPGDTRYAIGGPLAAAGADPSAKPDYGLDEFGTSGAVATTFFAHASSFGAATGLNYPDALTGGVSMATGGRLGAMLLVNPHAPIPTPITDYLNTLAPTTEGYVFGGPLAVGDDALTALDAAIG